MTDLQPGQRPITDGHRGRQPADTTDEGQVVRQHLQQLSKGQYLLTLLGFALVLTIGNLAWRYYWLPQKPVSWQAWSRFQVQQAVSLKRPVLVLFSETQPPEDDSPLKELWQRTTQSQFQQAFHWRAGRAFWVDDSVGVDQLDWMFSQRPGRDTLWFCPPREPPFQVTASQWADVMSALSNSGDGKSN